MFVLAEREGRQGLWKVAGLENEQLNEGRDLALTTDFRQCWAKWRRNAGRGESRAGVSRRASIAETS